MDQWRPRGCFKRKSISLEIIHVTREGSSVAHAEPELIRPMGPWQDFELLDGSLIVAEKYNEP